MAGTVFVLVKYYPGRGRRLVRQGERYLPSHGDMKISQNYSNKRATRGGNKQVFREKSTNLQRTKKKGSQRKQ